MGTSMTGTRLRTEYLVNPIGLGTPTPRFSWWPTDDRAGARQTAYQVTAWHVPILATERRRPLWDSGKVKSDACAHIAYAGDALASRSRLQWSVTLWDADDVQGQPSDPATFEIGLLERGDWQARWIGTPIRGTNNAAPPVPWLRKPFKIDRPIESARLYITALGLYQAHVNGQRVGDDYFRPGWTEYRKRVQYQAYDVTTLLTPGDNMLGALLGDGWYCGRVGWSARGQYWGDAPALLAQLDVTFDDRSKLVVGTDDSWEWRRSPILGSDLMYGEEYDARLEDLDWCSNRPTRRLWPTAMLSTPVAPPAQRPMIAEESWQRALPIDVSSEVAIVAQPNEPVRITQEIQPIADPVRKGSYDRHQGFIYDMGQNFAGVARLKIKGPAGATVRLRFAEMLNKDGTIYTANLRDARVTDFYTLRGDPEGETYTPTFTFHGFRYVEVAVRENLLDDRYGPTVQIPGRDAITGLVLHSDTPKTGDFACSEDNLNKLQHNITWGQRSNFLEVPTDCPQRDERLGWTGDAQVFAPTAAFNMDVAAFFTKWALDCDDSQLSRGQLPVVVPITPDLATLGDGAAGWSDARVLCPWAMYEAYGDRDLLEKHYEPMKRWLQYQSDTAKDGGIRGYEGHKEHRGFGDWLALDHEGGDSVGATPLDFIGTAYFARSAGVMMDVANALEQPDDIRAFAKMRAGAVEAFNREYFKDGKLTSDTQTAQLMALAFNLLPVDDRRRVFDRLLKLLEEKDWHLSTGFLGTPLLLPVLTQFGRIDVAYRVLMQTTYPGWLYTVSLGATTMWERWNSWTPETGFGNVGMNSFNHYAYGAVGRWMYDTIAGLAIDPHRPGYKHVAIAPRPGGGITNARASIDSIHGRIETAWTLNGNQLSLDVVLPPGVTASVTLPNDARHEIVAGRHHFEAKIV